MSQWGKMMSSKSSKTPAMVSVSSSQMMRFPIRSSPGTLTDIAGLVIAVALLLINVKKWEKGPKFIMDKHKAKQEQK